MEEVRYGIIGVGLMGVEHARNLIAIDKARLVCIADTHPGSIESCLTELDSQGFTDDITTYSSAADLVQHRGLDVVIVATPNFTHHDILVEAYEKAPDTLHFLVEKPLCTTIDDCRSVLAVARKRKGVTYVGLEYSYMPPVARVIADANAQVIGRPTMCSIREHRFPFLRKVRDWNRFNENTGGTLVEKTCHFFDLFNRIFSAERPSSVFASGAQSLNHLDEIYDGKIPDILDNAYVIINYAGGGRAMLDLCMFAEASYSQEEVVIVGTHGKLEAFLPQLEVRTGIRGQHKIGHVKIEHVTDNRIQYEGHHHGSSYLEHLDLLKAVRAMSQGRAPSVPTAGLFQGLMSVAMGIAAQLSIDEGRLVQICELLSDDEIESASYLSKIAKS